MQEDRSHGTCAADWWVVFFFVLFFGLELLFDLFGAVLPEPSEHPWAALPAGLTMVALVIVLLVLWFSAPRLERNRSWRTFAAVSVGIIGAPVVAGLVFLTSGMLWMLLLLLMGDSSPLQPLVTFVMYGPYLLPGAFAGLWSGWRVGRWGWLMGLAGGAVTVALLHSLFAEGLPVQGFALACVWLGLAVLGGGLGEHLYRRGEDAHPQETPV